ncbi:MAG TPA: MDR family MFS transporter [Solirubrobacteraceae bacterium]|nr:MDR family MFS transporter [Solirubrobacteraceae bacterium]
MSATAVREPPVPESEVNLRLVFGGLLLVMFLAALDQTIVATALPTIVGDLGGLNHISWVVTAYLLASTVVTPLYGKLGDQFGRKIVLQVALVIFLAGSALCGLSQSLDELIAFRALQGLGGGGLIVGAQAAIGDVVPPRERGRYSGLFGAVFGLASVAGPLLGGFLTTSLSWRWIFYVNLPLGVLALFVLAATLPSRTERIAHRIDYLGTVVLGGALSAIVLAASLGGTSVGWGSPVIIGLVAVGLILIALFPAVERRASEPILPPRLLFNRVFVMTSAVGFIVGFALFGAVTYMPLFLQVVRGATPTESGLQLLPLMGGLLITSIASGQIISRTGRYKAFPIAGTAVMVVGLYLLSTLDASSSNGTIYLFMFVVGLGLGMVMQVLVLAVQNAVDYSDLGVATSGATLFRSMGGSLGTAVLGAVFANRLRHELAAHLPPAAVSHAGGGSSVDPAEIDRLPPALHAGYLEAFTKSLNSVFLVAAVIGVFAFVLSWLIRELPLRKTVATRDAGDAFPAPTDDTSLANIVRMIGRMDRREGQREIVSRVAARAGVDLSPAACWLLARLSVEADRSIPELAEHVQVSPSRLAIARDELVGGGLVEPGSGDHAGPLTDAGREALTKLTKTGEQRLADLLEEWRPQEDERLARMIETLAGEFFIDATALCAHDGVAAPPGEVRA